MKSRSKDELDDVLEGVLGDMLDCVRVLLEKQSGQVNSWIRH